MSWVEETLKDTFRQSLEASTGANALGSQQGDECPSSERLWDAVSLILRADERRQIVDHTSRCASCAMVWQAALSMRREAQASDVSQVSIAPPAPSWWQRLWRPAIAGPALAASAALAVALIWVNQPAELDPLAAPVASGVLRGAGETGPNLTANANSLGLGDTLTWGMVTEADGYLVTITDSQGNSVRQVVSNTALTLDATVMEPLQTEGALVWSVEVVGGSASGARSSQQSFTFRGPLK